MLIFITDPSIYISTQHFFWRYYLRYSVYIPITGKKSLAKNHQKCMSSYLLISCIIVLFNKNFEVAKDQFWKLIKSISSIIKTLLSLLLPRDRMGRDNICNDWKISHHIGIRNHLLIRDGIVAYGSSNYRIRSMWCSFKIWFYVNTIYHG